MSKIAGKRTKDIPDSARKSGISRLIHSPNLLGLCVSSVCCDTLRYSADGETTPQNSLSGYSHSIIKKYLHFAPVYPIDTESHKNKVSRAVKSGSWIFGRGRAIP